MIANGKLIAKKMEDELKRKIEKLPLKKLCFVMFGENLASTQFVGMKVRMAERLGISATVKKFPEVLETNEVCSLIQNISAQGYNGIVVQLPLPEYLDTQKVLNSVPFKLDIDILSDQAKASFVHGDSGKIPPVARAVFEILDFYNTSLKHKNILLVGNGKLVGEPVASMLTRKGNLFHMIDKNSSEEEKKLHLKSADIIISGAGSSGLIKPDMVKDGVVLIDAGTSEQAGKLVGDIDPECAQKASLITPVPGGVGPVTVVSLFANLLD